MTLPHVLRWRLALGLSIAIAAVAGILATYTSVRLDRVLTRELGDRIATLTDQLAAASVLGVLAANEDMLVEPVESALAQRDVLAVAVYGTDGRRITARSHAAVEPPALPETRDACRPCAVSDDVLRWVAPVRRMRPAAGPLGLDVYDRPVPAAADATQLGWLVVDVSTASHRAEARRLFLQGLALAAGVLLLGVTFTLLFAWRLTRQLQAAYDQMAALNAAKDQFVAIVSHDFRSPLAVVLSAIQTVQADANMPDATRRTFLERAVRQCRRLQALVADLLDLARLENRAPSRAPHDLDQLVRDHLEGQRGVFEGKGLSLTYDSPGGRLMSDVDAPLIERALSNLLDNARKFTPPNGRVAVRLARQASGISLSVTDSGPGIPAHELSRLFERFFQGEGGQAQGEGAGLGLAIVDGIVKKHGGSVHVESHPGEGARFELRLPG